MAGVGIVGFTVLVLGQFGKIVEVVGGARNQRLAGLGDDLAAITGFHFGKFGHVLGDQLANPVHQAGAFLGGGCGPAGESGFGSGDRSLHFLNAAAGDFGQHLARCRIEGLERFPAFDLPAIDEMGDHTVLAK